MCSLSLLCNSASLNSSLLPLNLIFYPFQFVVLPQVPCGFLIGTLYVSQTDLNEELIEKILRIYASFLLLISFGLSFCFLYSYLNPTYTEDPA